MNANERWTRALSVAGGCVMLLGAIDPMEGSIVIWIGSGMMALATFLSGAASPAVTYRTVVFALITVGLISLWGLSAFGGVGGPSGHSSAWLLLLVPYVVGWFMGILGPGTPRPVVLFALALGMFYVVVPVMVLSGATTRRPGNNTMALLSLGLLGVLLLIGCLVRLKHDTPGLHPGHPTPTAS